MRTGVSRRLLTLRTIKPENLDEVLAGKKCSLPEPQVYTVNKFSDEVATNEAPALFEISIREHKMPAKDFRAELHVVQRHEYRRNNRHGRIGSACGFRQKRRPHRSSNANCPKAIMISNCERRPATQLNCRMNSSMRSTQPFTHVKQSHPGDAGLYSDSGEHHCPRFAKSRKAGRRRPDARWIPFEWRHDERSGG